MQTLILAYRGCILFEVIQAASFLDPVLTVKVATPEGDRVRDRSGVTVVPDLAYEEVKPGTIGCLLVPGGNPDAIAENAHAKQIVREVLAGGGVVAGICAGVVVLALAGVLRGRRVAHNYTPRDVPLEVRRHTDRLWDGAVFEPSGLAVDGAVITARPERHEEFAAAVATACGIEGDLEVRAATPRPPVADSDARDP